MIHAELQALRYLARPQLVKVQDYIGACRHHPLKMSGLTPATTMTIRTSQIVATTAVRRHGRRNLGSVASGDEGWDGGVGGGVASDPVLGLG